MKKLSLKSYLVLSLLVLSMGPSALNYAVGTYSALDNFQALEQKYQRAMLEELVSPVQERISVYKALSQFVSQLPAAVEILGKGETRAGSINKERALERYSGVIKRAFGQHPSIVSVTIYDTQGHQRLNLQRKGVHFLKSVSREGDFLNNPEQFMGRALELSPDKVWLIPSCLESMDSNGEDRRRLLLRMCIPIFIQQEILGLYVGDIDMGVLSDSFPEIQWVFSDGTILAGLVADRLYDTALLDAFALGVPFVEDSDVQTAWLPLYRDENGGQTLWAGQVIAFQNTKSSKKRILTILTGTFLVSGVLIALCIYSIVSRMQRFFAGTLECIETGIGAAENNICFSPTGLKEVDDFYFKLNELISEHQQMERERCHNEQIRLDFERMFRHDIVSPINGMMYLPEMILEDGNCTPKQQKLLHLLEETGYMLMGLVKVSLHLVRLEKGDYPLKAQPFNLVKMIRRIVHLNLSNLGSKNLRFQFMVNGDEPAPNESYEVFADEVLCFSMLNNLIKNSREAAPKNSCVTLKIDRDTCCDRSQTVISIHNLMTVPLAIRDTFFDKYVTSGKSSGTGMGTYSARLVALAHGGDIELITSEDEGTTVKVKLPDADVTVK